ncbi:DUF2796 domain-containing protein [Maricaulis sp.]|uniref:ZrgA family zinc uptake protein n=1 Tax=Maricaulis sp. TaxID=1486257 RepID=UPI00260F4605|nr:DUF2796 domain-containing protein [Maricaulis sp.]
MTFTALTALALVTATQSAHVHGHAEMAIAVEADGRLQIELTSPAYDFYGFEHAPRNAEQRAAIEAADTTLRQGATLFNLVDGNCTFDAAEISRDQDDEHHEHHHDGHDHEDGHEHEDHHEHHADHDHEDGHDHEEHHEHHAAHEGHDEDSHGDVRVTYSGRCAAPARISGVATTLFAAFPQLERVDGVFLSEQRQLAFELNPAQERARLPR